MATTVGEAVVKLTFDGKDVKASLSKVDSNVTSSGKQSGTNWANAWSVAAGALIAKAVTSIAGIITSNLDTAIQRLDIINNFPKVMSNMNISAEESQKSIDKLADKLQGLPTSLQAGASAVERLTSKNGDVKKSTDLFLALNNAILAGGAPMNIQANALEQLSQAYAKGKPDMMEWRTMQSAMPAQLNQISQAFLGNKDALDQYIKLAVQYQKKNPMSSTAAELVEQLNNVKNGTGDMSTALGTALRSGIISMDEFVEKIDEMNKTGIDGFKSFEEQARNSTGGVGTAMENVKNRIGAAIEKVLDHIGQENISKTINDISKSFSGMADTIIGIIDFIAQNWNTILPILTGIMTFVTGLLALGIGQKVIAFLTTTATLVMAHPILAILSAIAMAVVFVATNFEQLRSVVENVFNFIGNIIGEVGNFFSGLWNGMIEGARGAWEGIQQIFGKVAEFFGSIFSSAWEAVKKVFSTGGKIFMGIVDGITNAFRTIVNAIITGINHVVAIPFNAINGFLSFLKGIDILGIKPFGWVGTINVPQIPLLAKGGYADGATLATIGEAGKEVVLPLENNTDNWAGLLASELAKQFDKTESVSGRPIVVNMTNEINNEMDADDIGRKLMESIRRAS